MQPLVLLAQRARWERLGDRFRGGADFQWTDIIIWGGFLALLGVALFWFAQVAKRRETPRASRNPKGLFRELCRGHQLDRSSRQLLKKLAAGYGLPQPATLFLEPDRFAPNRLPKSLSAERDRIDALKDQLFATDEEGNAEQLVTESTNLK